MRKSIPFPVVIGLFAVAFVAAGCSAPPPALGPPPMPKTATRPPADESDVPPAPVLPDPRPDLPPVDLSLSGPAPEPVSPAGEDTASGETAAGAPEEPASAVAGNLYSVQVFASSTQANAEKIAGRVRRATAQPVEVVREADGMWRVYAGRAPKRGPIDRLRDQLNAGGFSGCWTKLRSAGAAASDANASVGPAVYSVQVFVSSERQNARRVAEAVRSKTRMDVEVIQVGRFWKVLVGRSPTRGVIDGERDRLRALGYPDAWTYLRSRAPER